MKRGFTLLELIIVIIIIGVLATLGFTQYTKVVEKGRSAEAKTVLGQIRTAEAAWRLEHDTYTNTIGDLYLSGITALGACDSTHYFMYSVNTTSGLATATRCTAGGKTPQGGTAYTLTLAIDGTFVDNTP